MVLDTLASLLGEKEPKPNKFTVAMGELIRKAREDQNITQAELAERIYRRRATVADIENGKHEPDASSLALLAGALNKPITYFYPHYLSNHITEDSISSLEQEMLLYFRGIQVEQLERLTINLVKSLSEYDPYETLESIVDTAKSRQEILQELRNKKNKRH